MIDTIEVVAKLEAIYNSVDIIPRTIFGIFVEQFGIDNVDSNIMSFDNFMRVLNGSTLGSLGISKFEDSNDYGHYSIDKIDYEANGRGKSMLEYLPDLGILDYLTPRFKDIITKPEVTKEIIVHFPEVRVTNEYDKFIDIQDLYVKVQIGNDGRMLRDFEMTRTTFPYKHFKSHYAHSHLPGISRNDIGNWKCPCLGSGPIGCTQYNLKHRYDEQLWGLFAFELSKYVTIESIAGGPYKRLESVGKGDLIRDYNNLRSLLRFPTADPEIETLLNDFVKYYARKNKFKIKYVNNQYQLGESSIEVCINLSNSFIEWYNDSSYHPNYTNMPSLQCLKNIGILDDYIVSDNAIYSAHTNGTSISDATAINGKSLFVFKGNTVTLKILDIDRLSDNNVSLLFRKLVCDCIITRILSLINYKYGKRNGVSKRNTTTQDEDDKKFCII